MNKELIAAAHTACRYAEMVAYVAASSGEPFRNRRFARELEERILELMDEINIQTVPGRYWGKRLVEAIAMCEYALGMRRRLPKFRGARP